MNWFITCKFSYKKAIFINPNKVLEKEFLLSFESSFSGPCFVKTHLIVIWFALVSIFDSGKFILIRIVSSYPI